MSNWFQLKEQGTGKKRLVITKFLYKLFGTAPIRIIAFCVAISVFLSAKERRNASFKLYKALKKPIVTSSLRQFINYANSLVDKIQAFSGNLNPQIFELNNPDVFKKGAFFITTHIGNIEILRSIFDIIPVKRVNIFLQASACEMFNSFLKDLEAKVSIETFAVEEITPDTSITITERLKNGEIVFMAGDRVSAQNTDTIYSADFFNEKITLPLGTLKFALMTNAPIYFILCAKNKKKYKVYTQKFTPVSEKKSEKISQLQTEYAGFIQKYASEYPYQIYHFHDLFE